MSFVTHAKIYFKSVTKIFHKKMKCSLIIKFQLDFSEFQNFVYVKEKEKIHIIFTESHG